MSSTVQSSTVASTVWCPCPCPVYCIILLASVVHFCVVYPTVDYSVVHFFVVYPTVDYSVVHFCLVYTTVDYSVVHFCVVYPTVDYNVVQYGSQCSLAQCSHYIVEQCSARGKCSVVLQCSTFQCSAICSIVIGSSLGK